MESKSKIGNAVELLATYPSDKFNLLYPSATIMNVSPLQTVSIEQVKIDANPEHQEVFKIGSFQEGDQWIDKLALAKPALEALSHAAGIIFDVNTTGNVPTGNPRKFEYRAHAALQKPDGTWLKVTKTKAIDLDIVRANHKAGLEDKAIKGDLKVWLPDPQSPTGKKKPKVFKWGTDECTKEIERQVHTFMQQYTQYVGERCETGAYNRVIRSLLGLKAWYTPADLAKPFVVVKVSIKVEFLLNDPDGKRAIIANALEAQSTIFGPTSENAELKRLAAAQPVAGEIVQSPMERAEDMAEGAVEAVPLETKAPTAEDLLRDNKEAWAAMTRPQRVAEVIGLVKRKGYTPKAARLADPELKSLSEQEIMDYLVFLWKMPDIQAEPEKLDFQ